jgi:hypothetical protein
MPALLDRTEEALALRLAGSQPESAAELAELLDRVRARVVDAVLADGLVCERLAGRRYRVLTADYREDKAPEGERPARMCEIGIYDYDADVLAIAVVDLRAGTVVEVCDRPGVTPPITAEELVEAREIASGAEHIRSLLADDESQIVAFPGPTYTFENRPRSAGHRACVIYAGQLGREWASAVVDLTARELVPEDELPEILRSPRPAGPSTSYSDREV